MQNYMENIVPLTRTTHFMNVKFEHLWMYIQHGYCDEKLYGERAIKLCPE
jgi:hypothetical protein